MFRYGFVPPYPPPKAVQTRSSKALPPLPVYERAYEAYVPPTPTSTSPSTLVGSPPSSVRKSTVGENPTSKAPGSKIKAFFTPQWELKEDATVDDIRLHKYGVLGKFLVDCAIGLVVAVKVLAKVAVPGLYWDSKPTEAARDEGSSKHPAATWYLPPGHGGHLPPPFIPLTLPPKTACAHGAIMCNDCTSIDLHGRVQYAWDAYLHNAHIYRSAKWTPALQARVLEKEPLPEKKLENWLCKHIVWNQNKK
jgi:hypothetical protein